MKLTLIGIILILLSSCAYNKCPTRANLSTFKGKTVIDIQANVDKPWTSRAENIVITFDDSTQLKVESGSIGHLRTTQK